MSDFGALIVSIYLFSFLLFLFAAINYRLKGPFWMRDIFYTGIAICWVFGTVGFLGLLIVKVLSA